MKFNLVENQLQAVTEPSLKKHLENLDQSINLKYSTEI